MLLARRSGRITSGLDDMSAAWNPPASPAQWSGPLGSKAAEARLSAILHDKPV